MTWTKLSDDFADDAWTLTDAAFRLHVEGLAWSNRKLLDLRIPVDDLRRFAKHPDVVPELIDKGFWIEDGDAYVIHHHARYQRTRDQVIAIQKRNQSNGQSGGRPKGSSKGADEHTKPTREIWTQQETQMGCQVETQTDTQMETHGDWTGRAWEAVTGGPQFDASEKQPVLCGWCKKPDCSGACLEDVEPF